MKYLVPVAAILTLTISIYARGVDRLVSKESTPVSPAMAEVRLVSAKDGSVESLPKTADSTSSGNLEKAESGPAGKVATPATTFEMAPVMMEKLESLELTEDQASRVGSVLEARELEIRDWHEGIRKSRVFDPKEYGRSLLERRELWYRKIDDVLDSRQHARFDDLVQHGFLRAGTDFTVYFDQMTVVR